jgi:hypothetical protein
LSKLKRDLAKGRLAFENIKKALTTGNKQSFATWKKRALDWIDDLAEDSKDALGISEKPKNDTVLGPIHDAISNININDPVQDQLVISKLQNAIDFVEEAIDNVQIGNRLSRARKEFLNALARLYCYVIGRRPTYKFQQSPFYKFATGIVSIYDPQRSDPGDVAREHAVAEDIRAAVGRHRGRKESEKLTVLGSYEDRRYKKRSRAPT